MSSSRSILSRRLVPGRSVLMRQGETGDGLYLVAVGRLRVSIDRDDGTETVVAELGRGEVVGELALITDEPRSATVTAVRDSQVLRLSDGAFSSLVRDHPNAQREITSEVVRRLVHSFREGHATSPVVTIAVVPLDASPDVNEIAERLQRSFERLTGAAGHVTKSATVDALGNLDRVGADRLAGWFAKREAGYEIILYEADHEPRSVDRRVCAPSRPRVARRRNGSRHPRAARRARNERQQLKCRTELLLVHPAGTRDPRHSPLRFVRSIATIMFELIATSRWIAPPGSCSGVRSVWCSVAVERAASPASARSVRSRNSVSPSTRWAARASAR